MARGRLITLEGGEGAGKTTQAVALAARLDSMGLPVLRTREPGGAPGAEAIRSLLVSGDPGRWDAASEALLMVAARRDHAERTIRPALERGVWVVCDRFADSTMAYQGIAGGLGRDAVNALHAIAIPELTPDLTLLFDLDPRIGLARARSRAADRASTAPAEDRFEGKPLAFHERLRAAFLEIAAAEPDRVVRIDADLPPPAVEAAIRQAVAAKFPDLAAGLRSPEAFP